ncbi:MAG: serine/threonine protein phosphatase PrpC [Myxococcota bacterium]|jgi:serine/threonine protein phosphatase PrpC
MRIKQAVYRTDIGQQRKTNQDGVLALKRVPLYAIADGTGGIDAARLTLVTLKEQGKHLTQKNDAVAMNPNTSSRLAVGAFFQAALDEANTTLRHANDGDHGHLAASLCAATVVGPYAFVAHVGDARAYLFRDGKLRCLTNDHTLATLQLQRGDITQEEYQTSPFRSTLSRALGRSPRVDIDVAEVRLMSGDRLMLCSNGLHRVVAGKAIAAALSAHDLEDAAEQLIRETNDAGAPDNVTVLVLEAEAEATQEVSRQALEDAVRGCFLFGDLRDQHWLRVVPYLEESNHGTGELICRAGEDATAFYVVASGRVLLVRNAGERREITTGGHFGSLTLAAETKQLDTAKTAMPSVIFSLSRERFQELIRRHPELGTTLALALLGNLGSGLGILTARLAEVLAAVQGR